MKKDIENIISQMTLEDKIALCSGENFWQTKEYDAYEIPTIFMSDGPHGLRKQEIGKRTDMLGINESVPATCFPAEITSGASWDVELMQRIGQAIGQEAKALGVNLVLGPGANLKRNPLCGRNFEYFSEDPYLTGKLAAGFIKGVEAEGVGSCIKHFACNSQEHDRLTSDSVIGERTLRELYLSGFETAVKEGKPSAVMCAYPKVNGTHCSDHKELLTDILRKEWDFDGMVVTDWGALNDRVKAFEAGCDLSMPGGSAFMEKEAKAAVLSGVLDERKIDASVKRILSMVYKTQNTKVLQDENWKEEHHRLAVEAAAKGAVLLKNDKGILPVNEKTQKLAIIGDMAMQMRFQGAGSSHINPTKVSSPMDFFGEAIYAKGCESDGNTNDTLLQEVAAVSKTADKVIVFAGLPGNYESEGFDRENLKMPQGHIQMIEEAAKNNENVIVVLLCGCVVECPWADLVQAILYMGLPGQGGGEAAFLLLTGVINPSGKLTESWPYKYEDVPSMQDYGKKKDALYKEGIYVGYRYYEKANKPVRFAFGHGLSYTSFVYSELVVKENDVTVTVTNMGGCFGEEVVALYIGREQQNLHRPIRELKRFCKIALEPGESKTVSFCLDDRCFCIYNDGWVIEEGIYQISVGNLTAKREVTGQSIPTQNTSSWYYTLKGAPDMASFEKELGRHYEEASLEKGSFTMDNTIEEMKDFSFVMKIVYKVTEMVIAKQFGGKIDYNNPEFKMLMKCSAGGPIRSMQISCGVKGGLFEGLLDMANGHFFRGIARMIK